MKKENISGLIVYLIIFCLTLVFALLVVREYFPESGMDIGVYILFILGAFVTGIVFNAVLFELAHILGAKIGRYNITSVCILGLTLKKVDGKWKFLIGPYDGLTGETKITPKTGKKKKPNPTPYLLFGTLFYAVEIIAVVFAFSFLQSVTTSVPLHNLGYFLLIVGVVGGGILIYNVLPLHLDSMTDGYRLILLSNKKNRDAFNNLLVVENNDTKGEINTEFLVEEENVAFSTDLNMNQSYTLLNEDKYEEANEVIDAAIANFNNKTSNKVILDVKAQKLFVLIMSKSLEEANEYYEKEISLLERREMANQNSMACVRGYALMAGLFDKSRSECHLVLKKTYKAYKRTPDVRKKLEIKLFNQALNKLIAVHPNWELENYRMNEEAV